jgi:hypothetical protein
VNSSRGAAAQRLGRRRRRRGRRRRRSEWRAHDDVFDPQILHAVGCGDPASRQVSGLVYFCSIA